MFQCINLFQNGQSLLLLWHNNKLYPPGLSRIAGFCTNSNKNFLGENPQTPLSNKIVWACIITIIHSKSSKIVKNLLKSLPPPYHFSGKTQDQMVSVSLISKVRCWSFFREMDVWNNKEKSLKSPWKCISKVLERSLKKVGHDLWEPWQ